MPEDNELIYLARQGCIYAYNYLYNNYIDYIRNVCKSHFYNYEYIFVSSQEVFSLSLWVLDDAIKNYFDDKNASFKTYLTNRVKYVILNHVRDEYRQNNYENYGNVNISALEDKMPIDRFNIVQERTLSDADLALCKVAIQKVKTSYTKQEFEMFKMYLIGYTHPEIAQILNVSKRSVAYKLETIIKSLQAAYGLTGS